MSRRNNIEQRTHLEQQVGRFVTSFVGKFGQPDYWDVTDRAAFQHLVDALTELHPRKESMGFARLSYVRSLIADHDVPLEQIEAIFMLTIGPDSERYLRR
jgi:tetrahydromethanopterin S-methyltransferase subunit E